MYMMHIQVKPLLPVQSNPFNMHTKETDRFGCIVEIIWILFSLGSSELYVQNIEVSILWKCL